MPYRFKDSLKEVYLRIRKLLLSPLLLIREIKTVEKGEIKKVLFLRHDRIGDMVLSTPALRTLKEGIPQAKVSVLASPLNKELLLGNPFIDEVIVYEKGFFNSMRTIRDLKKRSFDLVIDPFLTYELWTAFLSYLVGSKYRIGFEIGGREIFFNVRGPKGEGKSSILDQTLDLARAIGLTVKDPLPFIYLSDSEKKEAWENLKAKGIEKNDLLVGIHPGGYYESQRWPAERFAEIGDRMISGYKARVIIFGGKKDKDSIDIIKKGMRRAPVIMEGLGLRPFISILSYCCLLLCNNSGPLHIATALKVPTVSTMGPTVPYLWWPAGDNNIVLRKELECSPCNNDSCRERECMELITVEDMMEAVKKQMEGLRLRNGS